MSSLDLLPPIPAPGKIFCLGVNYEDHASESGLTKPEFPVLFLRVPASLVAHGKAIEMPRVSASLDFEGELVAIIGRPGKHISVTDALSHVAGYSIFNDGSVRDYQFKTPQWTAGKNFDRTGAFGPEFVSADEVPPGASGLTIETRLNGVQVQYSNTSRMIFDVANTIAILSSMTTLEPGDVLVMGTPAGVGAARTPPLYMKEGDVVEVSIEALGTLSNFIRREP
ncbi:fumarylacetoacetate hydrolase family protein [Caballeronia sp. 15715]|uniref:fumarylacetoacetate hydrolase family protein n=1 Tax=Caballeronia sp. 15715 TaxID=3391030 RepID=UPI0039E41262